MCVEATSRKQLLRLHGFVFQRSDDVLGPRMIGVPMLRLRSGAKRIKALVYAKDDASYAVVESNGGSERAPGWFVNLCVQPKSEIAVPGDPE